ncbi:MAG: hydroxymethylglutaryl-CoA reductase, degradative, partial [Oligoflexales bacterium]|nr:hydroxymethylglutaryl-CoA reductase, degradative [Oligoflexales bacterium]
HNKSIVSKETQKSSRIPGFYELPLSERVRWVEQFAELSQNQKQALLEFRPLGQELTDIFIENAIGNYALPLGVATNFLINGKDFLLPMVVEESSVLAACSYAAKLIRSGGGFVTSSTASIMTGQIQVFLPAKADLNQIGIILQENSEKLLNYANQGQSRLLERGGGANELTWRYIKEIQSLVIHLHVDTADAMGANIVNTMCEKVSSFIPQLFRCDLGLRILTNYTDRRLAKAECTIPKEAFAAQEISGAMVVDRIEKAFKFAYYDVYRATTNNKGIMNGIDAVLIATGNDWRAIEAGAHAYSCRDGQYRPMATWKKLFNGDLYGQLELPMAVGTVGGVTKLHPTAQTALKILGNPSARLLAEIIVSAGLAQNLAALRALATEGIQKGHMGLHQKNLDLLDRIKPQ